MSTKNLGILALWFYYNQNVLPLESHVETRTLRIGMGFQEHIIIIGNIIVHRGTGILDHYYFGAFHLHEIYQSTKKEQRDLRIPNL